MRRTVPLPAEIEEQIDRLLAVGVGENPREARGDRGDFEWETIRRTHPRGT